ncbi:MAG TPA: N-acetylmuramoyl-L-alanine amidase [Roseiflexaceae bacterium]|nr:N-acetylmuramoyl-L-alanine amidase [Roseiflexaceae bacterium]
MISVDLSVRSPNHSARPGQQISMLVIHATAGSARSALAWLTTPLSRVSAHYLIDKRGYIYQLVPDERMAWHAGRARWRDITAINQVSIGIELENANNGRDPYPPEQIDALLALATEKVKKYDITPEMVVRHCDVAVPKGRKTDPAGFPWSQFISRLFPQAPLPPSDRPPYPSLPGSAEAALARALREAAYRQVGAAERLDWVIAKTARDQRLGMPIGSSFDFAAAGSSYIAQSFGKDTLVGSIGEWMKVDRLERLVAPEQQPLREALLEAIYAQAGEPYRRESPLQDFALRAAVGPPLGPTAQLKLGDQAFVTARYALDTIFSPADRPKQIGRLSEIAAKAAPGQADWALAQALQEQLFLQAGSQLREDWPLHQYALREGLGAPLGRSFRISHGGRDYVAETFALDVIYCIVGDWKSIARLSVLDE